MPFLMVVLTPIKKLRIRPLRVIRSFFLHRELAAVNNEFLYFFFVMNFQKTLASALIKTSLYICMNHFHWFNQFLCANISELRLSFFIGKSKKHFSCRVLKVLSLIVLYFVDISDITSAQCVKQPYMQ